MGLDISLLFYLNGLTVTPAINTLVVFGATYLPWLLGGAFAIMLLARTNARKQQEFRFTLISTGAAWLAVQVIHMFIERPRPFVTYPHIHALFPENAWSFPSAHAAVLFALAMAAWFFDKRWGTVLFFGAFIVSLCRVIAGVHFPSDIVGGALLGIATAYAVFFYSAHSIVR